MSKKTRGEREDGFSRAIIRLEKEYLGRGPVETRTFFLNEMIVVRLRGILTQAEVKLCETTDGQALVKETRRRLFESSRFLLEDMVREIVGCNVISLHTDMSTKTGERIIVLTVDTNLDTQFG
jgi:uncharacterized protein YbcI